MAKGLLFVISGPSGAGKGSVYQQIMERTNIKRSVSVTTREPRDGEVEGVNYYFRSVEQYQQMIAAGEFLETAAVYDNYYGTPKAPVYENLEKGCDVMLEVDIHGAKSAKKHYPDAITIFLMTPDFETLRDRLIGRGSETEVSLKTRLGAAKRELATYNMFDYIVFNDDLEQAVQDVLDIINAEKRKVKNNLEIINKLLTEPEGKK